MNINFKDTKGIALLLLTLIIILVVLIAGFAVYMATNNNIIFGNKNNVNYLSKAQIENKMIQLLDEYYRKRDSEEIDFEEYLIEKKNNNIIQDYILNENNTYSIYMDKYEIKLKENNLQIIEIIDESRNIKMDFEKKYAQPGETINVNLIIGENVNIKKCKWEFVPNKVLGLDEGLYSNTIKESSITVQSLDEGTYYLHILITDSQGNKIERVSDKISIYKYVANIKLDKTELNMEQNDSYTLKATVEPDAVKNKEIEWTTSDKEIATVDREGKVKAIKIGKATITATSKQNKEVKEECHITVNEEKLKIGDYIDIGNNIVNSESTSDDWMMFLKDENKIYAILADNLPANYINNIKTIVNEEKLQMNSSGTIVWWNDREKAITSLNTSYYWKSLVPSKLASKITAKGALTGEQINDSFNQKTGSNINYNTAPTNLNMAPYEMANHSPLYGYWTMSTYGAKGLWCVWYNGSIKHYNCDYHSPDGIGLRPIIEIDNSSATLRKVDNNVWIVE